jgi:hypothetical protein
VAAADLQRRAAHPDAYTERLLDDAQMMVVLAEQLAEEPLIVEVKFERIVDS